MTFDTSETKTTEKKPLYVMYLRHHLLITSPFKISTYTEDFETIREIPFFLDCQYLI